MIEISRFVIDEMNKFSTLEVQEQVKVAKKFMRPVSQTSSM